MNDLASCGVGELSALIQARKASSVEVTQALLERIKRWQPALNAFVSVEADAALAAAKQADATLRRDGGRGKLHGVPLAHKDMYYSAGKPAGCGSKIRAGWIAPATSTAVAPLARSAADCGLMMEVIAGPDPLDPTTAGAPMWRAAAAEPGEAANLTIGVPTKFYVDDLDLDVATAFVAAMEVFRKLGLRV